MSGMQIQAPSGDTALGELDVAPVIPFSDEAEAIRIANDTESEMVHVDDQPLDDDPHVPFGGVRQSGLGRYNGEWIRDELTRTKLTSGQREDRDDPL